MSESRPMRVGVPTETAPGERRVALVPDVKASITEVTEQLKALGRGRGGVAVSELTS